MARRNLINKRSIDTLCEEHNILCTRLTAQLSPSMDGPLPHREESIKTELLNILEKHYPLTSNA